MPTPLNDGNRLAYIPEEDPPPEGLEPAYSEDGVDLTQIRRMLRLTPTERLAVLQDLADFMAEARRARRVGEVR
jgi:hypothetical protein